MNGRALALLSLLGLAVGCSWAGGSDETVATAQPSPQVVAQGARAAEYADGSRVRRELSIGRLASAAPEFNTEAYDAHRRERVPSPRAATRSRPSRSTSTPRRYANVRRFLSEGQLPPHGRGAHRGAGQLLPLRLPAARRATRPFARARRGRPRCPWKPEHRLVRIGLKGTRDRRRTSGRRATSSS